MKNEQRLKKVVPINTVVGGGSKDRPFRVF